MKRKRRFGDRSDGYRIRSMPPINKLIPHIMKSRVGSQNLIKDYVEADAIRDYIREKRRQGYDNFSFLHVLVAAYIRTVSQRPAINRFISGQKIFARYDIETIMTVKTKMELDAPETEVKIIFSPDATSTDVYKAFSENIKEAKGEAVSDTNFEKTIKIFNLIPNLALSITISLLRFIDYFGLLPKCLLNISPFHGSVVLTSMGSLGIPPIYHHLYDFGNCPVFISYGGYRTEEEEDRDGNLQKKKYVDFTVTTDERICDGYYFASALKLLHTYLENPSVLDEKPEKIIYDID
ncbi:MAG: hypothetical protein J5590_05720 [Clostridia bacterium]|nr:hypothetical protein [Clostridia bacterium]